MLLSNLFSQIIIIFWHNIELLPNDAASIDLPSPLYLVSI